MIKYILTIAVLLMVSCETSTEPESNNNIGYECVDVMWIDTLEQPIDTIKAISPCVGSDTTIFKYIGPVCKDKHIKCGY